MYTEKRELLCSKCRKRVSYHIFKRPAKRMIKGVEIEYEEYYGICDECKGEIYVPGLDDKNEDNVEKIFREKKNLITIPEIKLILEKYNIEKRPLSKLLGLGELTITRYIDGQLPSKKYSDLLFDVLNNEHKMKELAEENRDLISAVAYEKVMRAIDECEEKKKTDTSAERIALYVINSGREITNLFLQKILYYIKVISKLCLGKTMIPEPCEAWKYGPVFPKVYNKYKEFGKQEITINLSDDYIENLLSEEEKEITDLVLHTFGIYNAWFLKDLTHLEDPWRIARKGIDDNDASRNIMNDDLVMNYFLKMDQKYNLKSPEGIENYICYMKKRMME